MQKWMITGQRWKESRLVHHHHKVDIFVTQMFIFSVQREECPETNKELASVRSELKDPELVEEIQLRQTNSYPGIKFCNLRIQC